MLNQAFIKKKFPRKFCVVLLMVKEVCIFVINVSHFFFRCYCAFIMYIYFSCENSSKIYFNLIGNLNLFISGISSLW